MIGIRVLGTFTVELPDGSAPAVVLTQPTLMALLLYLVLAEPAGPQSRDSLLALLWPEADVESARHSLRNALYRLRQTLGEGAIVSRGERYVGLDPSGFRCDALEMRRALARQEWEGAVAMWDGDLAPGFHVSDAPEFEHWLDEQRTDLRRAATDAAWRRVDELERKGDAGLVAAAQLAWSLEPANEAGARRLMRLLDASGERAAALRAYDHLADYLHREYETEPSAETRALAEQLKARIEPEVSVTGVLPGAPQPAARETVDPDSIPPGSSRHRRRLPAIMAGIAGALLMAGLVSVFALRPARSAARRDGAGSTGMTQGEGTLRLPPRYREDTAGYASYLRALILRASGEPTASRDSFAALVDRKPLYAPAYSGLAHAYLFLVVNGLTPPAEGFPKAESAARQALALDSTLAPAYTAQGMVEMIWRWNPLRARELMDRAVVLDPNDPEGHILRGNWFRWQGEADSALAEARKTHELDPLRASHSNRVGALLVFTRRYAEAEAMYRQTIRDYPGQAGSYQGLSNLYRIERRPRDALEMERKAAEVGGDSVALSLLPPATSDSEATRYFAERSRRTLLHLETTARAGDWVSPGDFVGAYASVRDTTQTLRWLDSAVAGHDPLLWGAVLGPGFDWMRNDPRYKEWEAKLPWLLPGRAKELQQQREQREE